MKQLIGFNFGDDNIIQQKQFELFSLYNKTRDIVFQEDYFPHLIDEYLVNTSEYKLTIKGFATRIQFIPYTKSPISTL